MANVAMISNLGPRARKLVRYLGFAVVGLVTFVLAFQLTFPFDRVKDKVVEALSEKYDTTIGDVERGIMPGRMYFKAVSLRTRPAKAGDVATTFYIERLEVDIGLLALLHGTAAIKLDAKIGAGHIKGTVALSKAGTSIDVVGEDVPSANLPTREAFGLPMSGKLRFAVTLELPNEKAKSGKTGPDWSKADGALELACPSGCTIGDGKSKLKMALKNKGQQAFAEGGIDFGKLTLDSLLADVELKTGKLDLTKLETKSDDGEVHVDFDMMLNQDPMQSQVTGCLRFRGSDALLKREPKTHAALSTTGAPVGPDNLFHIKLDGPLHDVRRLGQVCGSAVSSKSMDHPGHPSLESPKPGLPPPVATPPIMPPAGATPTPAAAPTPAAPEDAGVADALHVPPSGPEGETPPPGGYPPPPQGGITSPPPGAGAPQ
jgi:type II secretion system protein N